MTDKVERGEARLRATPLQGGKQRLAHVLAVGTGWALFAWGWYDVLRQSWDTEFLRWLIAGSVVILPAVTLAWIGHNVGIHRRKGPRTGTRPVDTSYTEDWNGRAIVADFSALARAHVVVIDVERDGNRKIYRAADACPPIGIVGVPLAEASDDPAFAPPATRDWRAA